jgi:L-amino acid N-acyltransferase YncA
MEVRSAVTEDIPALLPLMRGYCEFYEASPTDEGLDDMARALIALPDDQGMLLAAEDESGDVIGFAAIGWKWSSLRGARIAVLEDLFVAPEARGKGAADALIREGANRARQWRARHDVAHGARQQPGAGRLRPGRRHVGDLPRVRAGARHRGRLDSRR